MNPSKIFIERPVATALLMVAILLAGMLAYRLLPLSALPEVDYPTIEVTTLYPGASPDVMSTTVTAPLERQFGQMPGLSQMTSTSSGGASVITLRFSLGLSLDVAEQEVQAAINAGANLLPSDLPMPPIYSKVNPADAPVLTIAVTSPSLPVIKLHDLTENRLAPKLSQVDGVGLVSIAGGRRPAVRIRANPQALTNLGLSLDDVRTAIVAANVNQAKGSFDGAQRASTIDANDQLKSAAEYQDVIIAWKNGNPLRLKDVASVVDDAENLHLAAWSDRTPGVILNVQRQPGANVIQTVERVRALLPKLQASLPEAMQVQVIADRTTTIRASVDDTQFELMLSIALVIMVIFLFLRSASATVIPSVAVPLSLVGTFGVIYLAGFSINNLTLMALTISTGFVVDDAIVMIENIARFVEEGDSPMQAALKGSKQIGFTIISLTVSLIAVLIPLLFMGDVVGRLFREFAITLSITILISAVVSLTLVPMMSGRWLRSREPANKDEKPNKVAQKTQAFFDAVIHRYDGALSWVLARLEARQAISYDAMAELQQASARAILQDPDVESLSSTVGVDAANNTMLNTGSMLINLKQKRSASQDEIMTRLRQRVANVAGATLYLQPTQDLTIDAETGPTQFRLSIEGADNATVTEWANKLVARLQSTGEVRNAVSDVGAAGVAAFVAIDRDSASRLGITASTIDDALYSAYGQRIVSTIFTETNQYRVILEARNERAMSIETLKRLPIKTGSGKTTPLEAIASITEQPAPLQITHVAQYPATTIGFDTAPGVSLGTAVDAIRAASKDIKLPPSVTLTFLGAAGAYQASLSNQLWLILAAVVCVYIVLGVLYESYIHPLTILSTLPSAGVGALLALILFRQDLGVIGIIGIILLIGIVKKNAIMMIDFAIEAEREEGKSPQDAIHQAALLRFRPILMTTLAALFAAVPLMLGWGEGAELRRPLGLAIFGGLIVSQLLTLFTTPVIYLGFDRLAQRFNKRFGSREDQDGQRFQHGALLETPPKPEPGTPS